MHQLIHKLVEYIKESNEIQGFLNMTAFTGRFTLNLLQMMCRSEKDPKKKRLQQGYSHVSHLENIDKVMGLAQAGRAHSLPARLRAAEGRAAEDDRSP